MLNENSTPENIEDDWMANFFDKCRVISDKEMQSLWSKVLAGEANNPKSFSKRTVNSLASLDKFDAELFTSLCGFNFFFGEVQPLVYNIKDSIYNRFGITFEVLKHLDSIGLISFHSVGSYIRKGNFKAITISYYGGLLRIEFKNDGENSFDVGTVMLTQAGQQLSKICGSKPVSGLIEHIIEKWVQEQNLNVWCPYPR